MVSSGEHGEIDFRLLGAFEVVSGGRVLEIGARKQRWLLAMLAVNLNQPVPVDVLLEELWGDRPPSSAIPTLQSLVSRLRGLFCGPGQPAGGVIVKSREAGYVLLADPAQVDANRFEILAGGGRDALAHGDPTTAAGLLREALGLWRGPALADLADREFARPVATRLNEARLAVVEDLADAELALGRPAEALARLEPHVAAHPLRERARGQLMTALYRLGRQADALRAYQELRRVLAEELGLEPTPALRQIEQRILLHSPELESSAPAGAATGGPEPTPVPGHAREPEDTEAFLFTDMEASTRRWEGDQEAMASDLARHDELLRQAVEAARGHVFSHTGDGLCAAFPTASSALTAAVAGQRALLDVPWAGAAPLRVRMAVHVGAAERGQGTYLGPTLNRTARLLALASGGQVLCSQAATELARDRLPPGVTLVDLGEHRLADLSRPERVFQVIHPDLLSGFEPLRASESRRHNLPLSLSSFVGRRSELQQLDELLAQSRLITLTGVGGAGKTRLALEVAVRQLDQFPDGVWLVDLGRVRDPALVPPEVAGALGMLTGALSHGPTAVEEWLCECLRLRQLLLIIDNCEHLVGAAAHLVHLLLTRSPHVAVLVTSREVLGLPGEVVFALPALSLPPAGASRVEDLGVSDAVSLFCERARAAQPGFGLSDANAGAVAQICRRLDGIPLALELAAARIRVLGAQQVADRLDQRFRLLTEGGRTAVPRHHTLRAAMDWSYDLLPPSEQVILRRLTVFPGTFDLEAAEAVIGEAPADPGLGFPVLDLVGRLVEKSLVLAEDVGGTVRYRLLETVREYAAEKLAEAEETEPARRRHRDFFLSLADAWRSKTSSGSWSCWIEPWSHGGDVEQDNFRAALNWSLDRGEHGPALRMLAALWPYWWYEGHVDVREWMERALARSADSRDPARWHVLIALALKLEEEGDGHRAVGLSRQALDFAERFGDPPAVAVARTILGIRLLGCGEREQAQRQLGTALAEHEAAGASPGVAICHHDLGWIAMGQGDVAGAKTHFERALAVGRQEEVGATLRVHFLAALAPLAALTGEPQRAEALATEGVTTARLLHLRRVLVMALTRAGETAVLTANVDRAREILRELLAVLAESGARRWVGDSVELAALLLEAGGQPQPAARLIGACDAIRQALGEPAGGLRALAPSVQSCRERLAGILGEERFALQVRLGGNLSIEGAISYALEWLEPPPLGPPG